MPTKNVVKFSIIGVAALIVMIFAFRSCTSVGATERGVMVTFGKAGTEILEPGLHFKSPIGQHIQCYDITPIEYEKSFSVGTDGAISKDLQTIGTTFTLYWKYDESKILDVVRQYKTKDSIYQPISTAVKSAIKAEVGKYSVDEIIANQNKITTDVKEKFMAEVAYLPIVITDFKISNWDWSDDYDHMIKETMNRTQQIKIAEAEANVAAANAQKLVKEAEAKLQAEKLNAEAAIAKAKGEADAKKAEADGLAYYNAKVAQNYQVEIKLKELEIEKIRAEKWNGREVPEQAVYVPNTFDLKK